MSTIASNSRSIISTIPGIILPNVLLPATLGITAPVRLNPIYQNPETSRLSVLCQRLFGLKTGYHGTSMGRLGTQIDQGKFKNIGRKIYFDSRETATTYALKVAKWDGTQPVVLEIGSKQKAQSNPLIQEGWGFGLGLYAFFNPDAAEVKILRAYQAETLE
jgi:hypothetical protein